MNEEKNTQVQGEETKSHHLIQFKNPYRFEGKEYAELDLSGLDNLTVQDAVDAQRKLFEQQEEAASLLTETTTAYARVLAVKATGKPVEFFQQMPRGVGKLVSNAVRIHLNSEKKTTHHVMPLEKPYFFQGKEYTEVDLRGVADLSSMHESHAENRMAREGFFVTENSFNYLYACVIASMATGLPEEFFTGLPLKEVAKLKNAVNDADFFG